MKQHLKYPLLLCLSYLLFFPSCKEDKNIEPVVTTPLVDSIALGAWTRHPDVKGDNAITLRFLVDNNKLYTVGGNALMVFDETHKLVRNDKVAENYINPFFYRTPFINSEYLVYSDPSYNPKLVKIHLLNNPSVFATINVSDIDSTYERTFYDNGQPCAILSNNKIILPSLKRIKLNNPIKPDSISPWHYFHVYQLSHTNNKIEYKYEKTIEDRDNRRFLSIGDIFSFDADKTNVYYLQYGLKKLNLTSGFSNFEVETFRYGSFGLVNDTLWGIGSDKDVGTQLIYKTNQWNSFILGNLGDNGGFKWYFLDNKHIIGIFSGRQIFQLQLELNINKFSLIELLSSGTRVINDIIIFKDRVYIASADGLFYKSLDAFFMKKK